MIRRHTLDTDCLLSQPKREKINIKFGNKMKTKKQDYDTSHGVITVERKKVKNLNMRIRSDGSVYVSVPRYISQKEIQNFIISKSPWIEKNRAQILSKPPQQAPIYTKKECLELFTQLSDIVFPIFAARLNRQKPLIKVRDMKTRWGTCNVQKRIITLNMRLAEKPKEAQEYVMLHEYVHFLHPNHGKEFHATMLQLMPDYKERRKLLREGY